MVGGKALSQSQVGVNSNEKLSTGARSMLAVLRRVVWMHRENVRCESDVCGKKARVEIQIPNVKRVVGMVGG